MSYGARHRRHRIMRRAFDREWFTRDQCLGCQARRDPDGRLPIGFCDPDSCLMARVKRGEV